MASGEDSSESQSGAEVRAIADGASSQDNPASFSGLPPAQGMTSSGLSDLFKPGPLPNAMRVQKSPTVESFVTSTSMDDLASLCSSSSRFSGE